MDQFLVVGLGNPGAKYQGTRHNIGFEVLDHLLEGSGIFFNPARYGDCATLKIKNKSLLLLKPTTFMNLSGKAVNYWLQREKIPLSRLLVIVDELALPIGKIRLKAKGSSGGHNGLKHIEETLGRQDYARLRIGIGQDFPKGQQVPYVLGHWSEAEQEALAPVMKRAAECVKSYALAGLSLTMTQYNR